MQVLVKRNAAAIYSADFKGEQLPFMPYLRKLGMIQGSLVNISTKYLFKHSFNAVMPDGSIIDLNERYVDHVYKDARKGLCKCGYCGNQQIATYTMCERCGRDTHLHSLLSEK